MNPDHESKLYHKAMQLFRTQKLRSTDPLAMAENLSPIEKAQMLGGAAYKYFASAAARFKEKGMSLEEEVFATRAREIREDMVAHGLTDPEPKIDRT